MSIRANDPKRKSWIPVPANSDFTMQNLPFGVFKTEFFKPRVGVAIGDKVLDLYSLAILGYFKNQPFELEDFFCDNLNEIIKHGKAACRELRNRVSDLLDETNPDLQEHDIHVQQVIFDQSEVEMLLPVKIGDYTDFYSSMDHATNVGKMFRDPANALLPNWKHIPVGYHGRASSIIPSGVPIRRPKGQFKPADAEAPSFGPCRNLDFELEVAFITFPGKPLGESISTAEAEHYIFGLTLFNDWSARDIQSWEYVPLGPFLAKNFASSMSPWVVTLDALEPFKVEGPAQEPKVLPYLEYTGNWHYDINLFVDIKPNESLATRVCSSNYKFMYWNMVQQLAHHTINGCNINAGDVLASGTISGPDPSSFGSMLELAWRGEKPIKMNDGSERKFINDGDIVVMSGYSERNGIRVGFGTVESKVLPAL
ncbi:MAG TPA: fumarylacetoacetase [Luteibaculaceae bacterium]|nr:fumarylacetoacetase [Luteibaculaceae bacterium]